MLNRLRAHPVSVTTQRGDGTVDDTYLRAVVNEYTENAADYPQLDKLLAAALNGDFGPIYDDVQYLVGRYPDGTFPGHGKHLGTFDAIKCLDSPTTQTITEFKQAAAAADKVNPLTGAEDVWASAQCLHWPAKTTMPPQKFIDQGRPPILLVGSSHDYRTPLSWARTAADQIKRSSLVETDNYGHTSYVAGNKCTVQTVNTYLLKGATPRQGRQLLRPRDQPDAGEVARCTARRDRTRAGRSGGVALDRGDRPRDS